MKFIRDETSAYKVLGYTPKLHHTIKVVFENDATVKDMTKWCIEFGGAGFFTVRATPRYGGGISFSFEHGKDAAMFLLRWGGSKLK